MDSHDLNALERLSNLIAAAQRQAVIRLGLQMTHGDILRYLSRCNRWSDTPMAVAQYLGLTKGTVSQSITLLAAKGFLEKQGSSRDARLQHLRLTDKGRGAVRAIEESTHTLFAGVEVGGPYRKIFRTLLDDVLAQIHTKHQSRRPFGGCGDCRHYQAGPEGGHCGLMKESVGAEENGQLCREHEYAA